MSFIGTNKIGKVFLGTTEIAKIYLGNTLVYQNIREEYIVFVDPVVEQICATNWGDGTGIKPSQAARVTNSQFGTTFRNNTDITSFDELQYFTGLTQISQNAFNGCTALLSITIPSGVTTMYNSNFTNCSSLQDVTVLSTSSFRIDVLGNSGDGTGVLSFAGNLSPYDVEIHYLKLKVAGNVSVANYQAMRGDIVIIKIDGNFTSTVTQQNNYRGFKKGGTPIEFFEVNGTITSTQAASVIANTNTLFADGMLVHLGYDAVANGSLPCLPVNVSAGDAKVAKVYVGDGSSASHDNAILAQYTNNTDWSAYASKLDTWYNYINAQNANPDYIN